MKNFAGIPDEFARLDSARVVVIPVPYDGTSTWVKGADRGPAALLHAAENMELYDIETDSEVFQHGIHLHAPVEGHSSPEDMCEEVRDAVMETMESGKLPVVIGGEHSVSIGAIKAARARNPELTVLQIDAHADLRPSYEGSECNHACAMHWASQNTNLIQVGIRSMDISEKEFMNEHQVLFGHEINAYKPEAWIDEVLSWCTEKVYITIDLDGFDPSILPSTGTPEPGGLTWSPTIKLLRKVIQRFELVGFDVVELCPNPNEKASDFIAAKLLYKMLSYHFESTTV